MVIMCIMYIMIIMSRALALRFRPGGSRKQPPPAQLLSPCEPAGRR